MSDDHVRISISDLAPEHHAALEQVIYNIITTTLARETFAQIADGIPTRDVYRDYYPYWRQDFHENLEASPESMEIVKTFQAKLPSSVLQFDSKVAQRFQDAPVWSRDFHLRLLEVVAIAFHEMATSLFVSAEGGLRKASQPPPEPPPVPGDLNDLLPRIPIEPHPTHLYHPAYSYWEQYPNGIADMVGYWAEYRLFGGVVLFDRGHSGTECKDAFVHPVGGYQIFKLSEDQIQRFADFARAKDVPTEETTTPFRFRAEKYARRVDPYDAMSLCIYRDKYERAIPESRPRRCVTRLEDYPDLVDALEQFDQQN